MVIEKMHRADKTAHVEVIIMYAMIAIARQVIILDVKELPSMTLVGSRPSSWRLRQHNTIIGERST
jgi:hypothetical protein